LVPKRDALLDPAAMIAELKNNLANYKVPKQIYIVDELPRNAMGKVQKALLRELHGRTTPG
jgi:malonyl-CoA/methylmalonyl-CoA synthetase